jgi:hypothetical protein
VTVIDTKAYYAAARGTMVKSFVAKALELKNFAHHLTVKVYDKF